MVQKESQPNTSTGQAKRASGRVSQSDVPSHTLDEALRIPKALSDEYGKRPASPVDVGAAIGLQPTTGKFRSLAGAALAYGLTDGGPKVKAIGLTDLGLRIVAPTVEGDDLAAMREAFLRPRIIGAFLEKYDGSKIPSEQIGRNVLESMGVASDATPRVLELILSDAQKLGLLRDIGGSKFVQLKGAAGASTSGESLLDDAPDSVVDELIDRPSGERLPKAVDYPEVPIETAPARPSAIFLGHGKNRKALEQLIKTLDQYGIPHKEAVEEANRGRPISQKVADTMRECGAAILIFSADEKFLNSEHEEVWRPSENVVHELGAASVLYENRIVIFKEGTVSLATNYGDIGYIEFEHNALDAKVNELFRELIAFGLIKVTVGQ
jgi:CAP12/Pycsar effector protein, TIR domain